MSVFIPQAGYNISLLTNLESELGVKFHSAKWYLDWGTDFTTSVANAFHAHGAVPELTWEPSLNGSGFPYTNVTSGQFDAYINNFATSIKNFGHPIRVVLAPEMNTTWTPWGVGSNGNNDETHKAFWRYVVQKFRDVGASNVQWVWSPNIHPYGELYSYAQMYPGDSYVDFLGLEGYNWGTSQPWSAWQSFREVFESSYNSLTALSGKNILLTEIASTEAGGNKAQWITAMGSDLRNRFGRIQGFTWFHMNKETDWRITSSSEAKAAFSAMVSGVEAVSPSAASATNSTEANTTTKNAPAKTKSAPSASTEIVEPTQLDSTEETNLPVPVQPKVTETLVSNATKANQVTIMALAFLIIGVCLFCIFLSISVLIRRAIRQRRRIRIHHHYPHRHFDAVHVLRRTTA